VRIPPAIHRWTLRPSAAIRLQERLAPRVRAEPLAGPVRLVAGADLAFSPDGLRCLAGLVVYDLAARKVVEEALAWRPVCFPYVPGLLSFREIPAVLAAARRLKIVPDVFMFDGQGYAHPRRIGLASHAGLVLGRPAIGAAKSRLIGTHAEPPPEAGTYAPLEHRGEVIGAVLRTRADVRPIYVSAGHLVTLDDAIAVTMACVTRYRVPEPTRLAHQLVTRNRGSESGMVNG
jgi:deoxyribonuclease V